MIGDTIGTFCRNVIYSSGILSRLFFSFIFLKFDDSLCVVMVR